MQVNIQTPVQLFKGFNEVPGNILYDTNEKGERGKVIATFSGMKNEEKEEIIKRINNYPKLIKLIAKALDDLGEDATTAEMRELKNAIHNVSRKKLDGYK